MSVILDKYVPYGYRIIHGGHTPRQEPLSAGDVVIAVDDRRLPFGKRIYFKVAKTVVINGENVSIPNPYDLYINTVTYTITIVSAGKRNSQTQSWQTATATASPSSVTVREGRTVSTTITIS